MPGARDGQLRIHRGTDSPPWALQMFDDELGLWLTLAQANMEEDLMLAGVPILRGPYTVDYTDIPHDGDVMTLWTPAVGDVLLRLFADPVTGVAWDHGYVYIGQNVDGTITPPAHNVIAELQGRPGYTAGANGDNIIDAFNGYHDDATGTSVWITAVVFHATDPVQIQLAQTGGTDPTQGHVELYALVARAVAP